MKKRKYTHDYFNIWRDSYEKKYIWLQVDYLTETLRPYHFIFEINDERDGSVIWPLENQISFKLPYTNLDFRGKNRYIFDQWHNELERLSGSKIRPQSNISEEVSTYENYIRTAKLKESSCVDIDVIEVGERVIGIEGTHLYKEMSNYKEALRLFGFILDKRFFLDGAHQLLVQFNTMELLSGDLYLLIYNTKGDLLCEDCNSLIVKIDCDFIAALKQKNKAYCLNQAIFGSFRDNYKKITKYL